MAQQVGRLPAGCRLFLSFPLPEETAMFKTTIIASAVLVSSFALSQTASADHCYRGYRGYRAPVTAYRAPIYRSPSIYGRYGTSYRGLYGSPYSSSYRRSFGSPGFYGRSSFYGGPGFGVSPGFGYGRGFGVGPGFGYGRGVGISIGL